jgi:hypothetical protein
MEVAVGVGCEIDVGGTIVSVGRLGLVGVETGVGVEQDASRAKSKIQSVWR